jgi:hypothetical protein
MDSAEELAPQWQTSFVQQGSKVSEIAAIFFAKRR